MPEQQEPNKEAPDLTQIWELLRDLDMKVQLHIQEESAYKPKMVELINILERSKGAITFMRYTTMLMAMAAAGYAWLSSHVTWKG